MSISKLALNYLSQVANNKDFNLQSRDYPRLMTTLFATAGGASTAGSLATIWAGPKAAKPASLLGAAAGLVGSTALRNTRMQPISLQREAPAPATPHVSPQSPADLALKMQAVNRQRVPLKQLASGALTSMNKTSEIPEKGKGFGLRSKLRSARRQKCGKDENNRKLLLRKYYGNLPK